MKYLRGWLLMTIHHRPAPPTAFPLIADQNFGQAYSGSIYRQVAEKLNLLTWQILFKALSTLKSCNFCAIQ